MILAVVLLTYKRIKKMKIANESYICKRCDREVNPMSGSCSDMNCPLFDPRYEETDDEPVRSQSLMPKMPQQ